MKRNGILILPVEINDPFILGCWSKTRQRHDLPAAAEQEANRRFRVSGEWLQQYLAEIIEVLGRPRFTILLHGLLIERVEQDSHLLVPRPQVTDE
ncbi:MAG TPA: hypothetical protein VMV07_21345 [Streptosporangiaceae bacterium]|nr:hypothetical protein [Streptosporangiaceae bacterium]